MIWQQQNTPEDAFEVPGYPTAPFEILRQLAAHKRRLAFEAELSAHELQSQVTVFQTTARALRKEADDCWFASNRIRDAA